MTSIGELRKQVEAEPDRHDLRWHLAKKLFAESDYREALTHLRILKNEWERRLNVLRYLAAAYYRMGRYDDAVDELLDCLETWPNEIAVREQLAKVYDAAGRQAEALREWEHIRELDPGNRTARKALMRQSRPASLTPRPMSVPHDSDDGLDLRPVAVCPQCGAQNSAEFERCWQCGNSLAGADTPMTLRVVPSHEAEEDARLAKVGGPVLALLLMVLIPAALYITLREAPPAFADPLVTDPPRTVAAVLLRELVSARLSLWLALVFLCPVAISLLARALKFSAAGPLRNLGLGIAFATAVYLGSWLPVQHIYFVVGLTAAFTLPIAILVLNAGMWRGAAVWLLLVIIGGGATSTVYLAFVGAAPFEQAQLITDFATEHDAKPNPGEYPPFILATPARFTLTWASTDSTWLDTLTNDVAITLLSDPVDPPIRLELYLGERLVDFAELTAPEVRLRLRVEAGAPYRTVLRGEGAVPVEMHITGVLTPTLIREP